MAKHYEVIGTKRVHGHVRGEKFWADIPPEIEAGLLGVHIALVLEDVPRQRVRARLVPHYPSGVPEEELTPTTDQEVT